MGSIKNITSSTPMPPDLARKIGVSGINEILDVARLEADRVTFTFEECDVVPLCHRVLASVSQARKSENEFIFECDRESMDMRTDTQRLQQVIINLLSNADKFTRNGKITLGLKVDEKQRKVLFSVSDTGTGIPWKNRSLYLSDLKN